MRATCGVPLGGKAALVAVLLCTLALSACGSKNQQTAASSASTAQTGNTEPASAAPAGPAPAVTETSWSPDSLDKLVAPIALYPDALVGQILTASVNSQEVLDAGNWLLQNQSLQADALDSAAQQAGFGPATRALVQFPQVVDMMCQEIDWTRQLGAAFTSDQQGVLDAVQHLRAQAQQVGNLQSTPQQKVTTKTENEKTIIEVQPANPQVIYVPQYNPQVVYTTPPPSPPPATAAPASTEGTVSTGAAVAGGLVAFGVGMLIGSAIHNDDCCYPHWGAGAVYVGPKPFYPPAYVYRPAYGPAFSPAHGYASPPSYRYNYNNINRNVNVNVNNNYFNQFNHNQNLRANTTNNLSGATRNPDWKGQSSYAGAHANPAQQARFNEAMGRPASTNLSGESRATAAGAPNRAGGAGSTRNPALAGNRTPGPGESRAASANPGGRSGVDRGYGGSNRPGDTGLGANRDAGGVSASRSAAAAGGGTSREAGGPGGNRDPGGAGPSPGQQRDHAFSGANDAGGGGFARAASARGNASTEGGGGGRAGGGLGGGRGGARRR